MLEETDGSQRGPSHRFRKVGNLADGAAFRAPAGYRLVRVVTESSPELEDLASFRRDFEMARLFASTYLGLDRGEEEDPRRPESAYWIAALTLYGRAFATGVRKASVSLDELSEDERATHQYFIDLRNKYVAHSVNGYEGSTAFAYITDSAFSRPNVTRVGQVHVDVVPLDEEELEDFIILCTQFIDSLQHRIERLNYDIRGELLALGPQAVYALPDLERDLEKDLARESVARRRRLSGSKSK
jgi:hypothetical protein